jgi:hypothetical protein
VRGSGCNSPGLLGRAEYDFAKGGGLLSYSVDLILQFRQAASYVDRILKGEKPSELRVQGPTKFELAINLKTAKALGLSPSIARVALVFNLETSPQSKLFVDAAEAASSSLGVEVIAAPVHSTEEIETTLVGLSREPNIGLVFPIGVNLPRGPPGREPWPSGELPELFHTCRLLTCGDLSGRTSAPIMPHMVQTIRPSPPQPPAS